MGKEKMLRAFQDSKDTEPAHCFPHGKKFHFNLDVSVSTTVSLELSNIKCVLDDNGCSYFRKCSVKTSKELKVIKSYFKQH